MIDFNLLVVGLVLLSIILKPIIIATRKIRAERNRVVTPYLGEIVEKENK